MTVSRVERLELDAFSYGLVEVDPDGGTPTISLKDEDGAEPCRMAVQAE